jgi:hypothetical protein
VNLGEMVRSGEDFSNVSSMNTTMQSSHNDPYIKMAKNVEQRKEYDFMEWDDDIQGSC